MQLAAADVALAVAIAVLIGGAGFFAVAETSLIRMTPAQAAALVAAGRRGARSLRDLVVHPDRYLNTLLLLALGCQLVAATLVGVLAGRHLGTTGVAVATTVEVVAVFVLAEAAPKSWAVTNVERAALLAAPIARALTRIEPLRALSSGLVRLAGVLLPGSGGPPRPLVTEDELLATADVAAEGEVIEPEERTLIHAVIAFGDKRADQIMVPTTEMVTVDAGARFAEALEVVTGSALSRVPVVDGDPDHVVGLLYAKDVLAALATGDAEPGLEELVRPAPAVAPTERLADLLQQMRDGRYHMVIVSGAGGRTVGLVTIEDLIEELVGEIEDEHDLVTGRPGEPRRGPWPLGGGRGAR